MLTSPTCSEIGGNDAAGGRHTETTKVDGSLVGEDGSIVMSKLVVPLLIQVTCGVFERLLFNKSMKYYGINSLHFPVYGSLTRKKILTL